MFKVEVAALLNQHGIADWDERATWLLEDAFSGVTPRDDFSAQNAGPGPLDDRRRFLANLLRQVDTLPELSQRAPYWSERRSGSSPGSITIDAATREFVRIVEEFDRLGYFEQIFEKDCVDAPSYVSPSHLIEQAIGKADVWPLRATLLAGDQDLFFDVIEVLHDLVSRPRSRWLHTWNECGWHHGDFSQASGRALYRWRINRLLNRTNLGFQLADDGEDVGRLIAATDDERAELSKQMANRNDANTGDRVRHALALFRSRGATEHDKRSAIVTLAGILEERRKLLKRELMSKDEGSLFEIANNFAIRHQSARQSSDYDPVFLDWVFWWYLATVELTDRLLARQGS